MKQYQFEKNTSFKEAMNSRISDFLAERHITGRDSPLMYAKAVLFISWAGTSYVLLLSIPSGVTSTIMLALSLALSLACVGFNIQHDGNHGSFSRFSLVNRLAGMTLDLFVSSSWIWKVKHNRMHHTFTNVQGLDGDINASPFGRMNRKQPHYWFHRYQHWYLWVFYGFVHIKYLYGDFHTLAFRKPGEAKRRIPKGWEMVGFIAGKVMYFTFAFAVPMLFCSWWKVVICYGAVSLVMGVLSATVFQLAHMVEIVADEPETPHEFVVHQITTTCNFATNNPLLTFFLGGLNFQREHHVYPKISHVYYPALSQVVKQVCQEYGVQYHEQSFFSALLSHYRHLRFVGQTV